MPVTTRFIKDKYRVVEASTGKVAKNKAGTAVDGGGHTLRRDAKKQARAINASEKR